MSGSEKAMDYTRMQRSLLDHHKFLDLIEYLEQHGEKFTRRDVWGSLGMMWLNVAVHYADGQIHDDHDVERRVYRMSDWHGKIDVWVNGLLHVRFLERNEDGFYVHNWMEKHARQWWLKNEAHERERGLAKARVQRWRDRQKEIAKELKVLKEKGVSYDASPPPSQKDSNAETAFVTRNETLRNVTSRNVTEHPILDVAKPVTKTESEKVEPQTEIQKDLIINSVQDSSVRNALRDVTLRSLRYQRREEKRREETKDKDATAANNAALTPVQRLVKVYFDLFQETTGNKSTARGGYLGTVFGRLKDKGYDAAVIHQRLAHFFKSTYAKVKDKNFPPSLFEQKFDELEKGPLIQWEDKTKGRFHGQYDKRTEQFQTSDDFGTDSGNESAMEAGAGGAAPRE